MASWGWGLGITPGEVHDAVSLLALLWHALCYRQACKTGTESTAQLADGLCQLWKPLRPDMPRLGCWVDGCCNGISYERPLVLESDQNSAGSGLDGKRWGAEDPTIQWKVA